MINVNLPNLLIYMRQMKGRGKGASGEQRQFIQLPACSTAACRRRQPACLSALLASLLPLLPSSALFCASAATTTSRQLPRSSGSGGRRQLELSLIRYSNRTQRAQFAPLPQAQNNTNTERPKRGAQALMAVVDSSFFARCRCCARLACAQQHSRLSVAQKSRTMLDSLSLHNGGTHYSQQRQHWHELGACRTGTGRLFATGKASENNRIAPGLSNHVHVGVVSGYVPHRYHT